MSARYPAFDGTQACAQVGFDFYFPIEKPGDFPHERALRAVCEGCVFLEPCREWAIWHEEYGYWGGMTPRQRLVARRAMRKQAAA